ncbi:MAG: type II toxin-antitoxin system RelE/ParE family toxin [Methanosarcinales archaeon]
MYKDDKTYSRIDRGIQDLKENPLPRGVKKLKGTNNKYRIRQGNYRILYEIDKESKLIIIYRIKHRKKVYR